MTDRPLPFDVDDVIQFRYQGAQFWTGAGIDGWRFRRYLRLGDALEARLLDGSIVTIPGADSA